MKACPSCGCYARSEESSCPHCGAGMSPIPRATAAALLLGLSMGLNGCPMQAKYGAPESVVALYGVEETGQVDDDGDGYAEADGDCDDADENIHPDATETTGDGVDSNCNGEDDT